MMDQLLAVIGIPSLGWAFYVERRLAALTAIESKVDKVDTKVDSLINYAIEGKLSNERTEKNSTKHGR